MPKSNQNLNAVHSQSETIYGQMLLIFMMPYSEYKKKFWIDFDLNSVF